MKLKLWAMIGLFTLASLPTAAAFAGSTTSDTGFGVDPCYKQCSPLLGSVSPRSEAQRVFKNCMAYCQHKGRVNCGNGVSVSNNRFCPGNRLKAF
jgi:hypothetical protein